MSYQEINISQFYEQFNIKISKIRQILNRPLTLTEKILYAHLTHLPTLTPSIQRGAEYIELNPDRVAMQDATAQMALLQFMQAGKRTTSVPTTIFSDHLIIAKENAETDLENAKQINKEVYDFLSQVTQKYKIGYWQAGSGIIHQLIFENEAFPGGLIIGTDSHTPTAGGLAMMAVGVGGADAVDVMVGMPWELKLPKIMGIKLTGQLNPWCSPKDIILKLAGFLTVKGGTGYILEYFGDGLNAISATGKSTICNMGAEIGATTSLFPLDQSILDYLNATNRSQIAQEAAKIISNLTADPEVQRTPQKYVDHFIEINLNEIEPYINGPFTPDKATPISQFAKFIEQNQYPHQLSAALIGSCTNSSYEDLDRCRSLADQAQKAKITVKSDLYISPGSDQILKTIQKEGITRSLQKCGATFFTNSCGPCIGQWARPNQQTQPANTILTTFNRNFAKRNDGNPNTYAFVASPEIVFAMALAGDLRLNPLKDSIQNQNGEHILLTPPTGTPLPPNGFLSDKKGYIEPHPNQQDIKIQINPNSERLQLLTSFQAWNQKDLTNLRLLIKVKGKCTTDHISMAGPWLKYRGHLDNISNNLLIGAVNAFNNQTNCVKNQLTGQYQEVPKSARDYLKNASGSIVIGEENYGEGSSREHAAMEPRHLGVKAVIVKSFARIHETNLKKQGVLALTFQNKDDYDKIKEDDTFDIIGLTQFSPTAKIVLIIHHQNQTQDTITLTHTYNQTQIEWFKAGSAINKIKSLNIE